MAAKLLKVLGEWERWPFCSEPITAEQVSVLAAGLTNQCYVLSLPSGQYVLRIAGGENLDIQRQLEYRLHKQLANQGLAPALRYCAADFSYWLRDYVAGQALTAADLSLSNLRSMVSVLKQVHQLPLPRFMPVLDIPTKAQHYWQQIENLGMNAQLAALKQQLQHRLAAVPGTELSLCHLDPTPANWLLTPEQELVLLDWEYAALGHPLWDLAGLLQQAQLSPLQEQSLLAHYGCDDLGSWQQAKAQMRYLEVLWYRVQQLCSSAELAVHLQALLTQLTAKA